MNRLTLFTLALGLLPLSANAEDGYVRPTAALVVIVVLSVALIASIAASIIALVKYRQVSEEGEPSVALEEAGIQKKRLIKGGITTVVVFLLLVFSWQWKVFRTNIGEPQGAPTSVSLEGGVANILDRHIPTSGAQSVPRNTSIYLWFSFPMDRTSLINDHGTPSMADDTIQEDHIRIWRGDTQSTPNDLVGGVRGRSDAQNQVFALDPTTMLGSALRGQMYTIELRDLRSADGKSAFGVNGFYRWSFTLSRTSDTSGPKVLHVFPDTTVQPASINTGIQIEWNEAVDPLSFSSGLGVVSADKQIPGVWTVAEGERLSEFFSSNICGLNSCRKEVTCFPPSTTVTVIVNAVDASAYPRQGVRDLQGNLIRPTQTALASIRTGVAVVESTPAITAVEPRPNASGVAPGVAVRAQFSNVIRSSTVNRRSVRLEGDGRWRSQLTTDFTKNVSTITIDHEELLPEAVINSIISADIEDMNQNCFAQCKGP